VSVRRYVARIDGRVTIKMGPRFDLGTLSPAADAGWKLGASGPDFAVWEKAV
jgi:alpha-amylase